MRRNQALLLIAALPLSSLSSCSNGNATKWSYTKEEMSSFASLQANLESGGGDQLVFSSDSNIPLFKQTLSSDALLVYDIDKAAKLMEEKGKEYADYSVLKEASLPVSNVSTPEEKDGFSVTFSSSDSSSYGMLIHPSYTLSGNYIMVSPYENDAELASDPQAEFEETYARTPFSWSDGGKFAWQLLSNIGTMLVGKAAGNPVAIASGIIGIISSLGESLSGGASIETVMNQLKETDRKIDELSQKIEKNTQQLSDEIVRAETLVDQTNLNTLNLAINDFATSCLAKIDEYNRNLADEVASYYRDLVKSSKTVKLVLTKNEEGEYSSASLTELGDSPEYNFTLTISEFPNAKAHLSKNSGIVEEGFVDEMGKDIDSAIASSSDVPEGLSKESLRSFVLAMIYEEFMQSYFSSNKTKAQEYNNLVIDLSKRISGSSGMISILNTYLSRLQCMYNFGSEIKPLARTISANLLETLDMNAARAASSRYFAKDSAKDLETYYKAARTAINDFYKNVSETPDAYSFTTSSSLSGGFYQTFYEPSYDNLGNHCTLTVEFAAEKVTMKRGSLTYIPTEMSKHHSISVAEHSRIAARWKLLRASGNVDANLDYIHYLNSASLIDKESLDAYSSLASLYKLSPSCYRILTGDRNERELNSSDSDTALICQKKGNPHGDYFQLDKTYAYSKTHTDSYWYGKTYEGSFVDASTGSSIGTQKIATWARYAEAHWYWTQDEFWAFSSPDETSYFFSVDLAE